MRSELFKSSLSGVPEQSPGVPVQSVEYRVGGMCHHDVAQELDYSLLRTLDLKELDHVRHLQSSSHILGPVGRAHKCRGICTDVF